ncbi:MAG: TRAP transporter small permease [Succiniclasticum sp.]
MKENKISWKSCIANLDIIIASVVLAILIVLTFAGVIWRYCLSQPFTWMEEAQLACMVWIVFAAAGAAFRLGNHVAIEMIVDLLPAFLQKIVQVFISIVVVAVLGYLFVNTLDFVEMFYRTGRTTSILKIPYWLIYGIAIPAYIDMLISYFYSVFTNVKSEAKEAASGHE